MSLDLSKVLEDYLQSALKTYSFTKNDTINELDLTLPSSYADKLQDIIEKLAVILGTVIAKLSQSKVNKVNFPQMRIDLLAAVMVNLNKELSKQKIEPQFDMISLPFSANDQESLHTDVVGVIEHILAYKPIDIYLVTNELDENDKNLPKKLKEMIQNNVTDLEKPEVYIGSNCIVQWKQKKRKMQKKIKQEPQKSPAHGKNQKVKKELLFPRNLTLPTQSQVFAFDFHTMVPYSPETRYFTAYKYWKIKKIHEMGNTGKGITVAIVDTGISPHYAFKDNVNFPEEFSVDGIMVDRVGHGTICAGILGGKSFQYFPDPNDANGNKEDFPCGVAPNANLVIFKVTSGASKTVSPSAVAKALQWISNENIDVVSLSMGSLGISLEVVDAINRLVSKGVIVVCAASNFGHQFSQPICFPARLGHVLCIGSHGPHGKPSLFSPIGQDIDFLAPGENVAAPNSTFIANHVAVDSGTSYAASAVAGLICLILQYISSLGDKFGTEIVKQFKNHWVMKEILRKISTCPGRHTDDEGFGALNPLQFFQRPDHIIQMIHDEVINPVFTELSQE